MTEQQDQFQQEWRLSLNNRLSNLETSTHAISADLAKYHLDIQRQIADERERRRDDVELLRKEIAEVRVQILEAHVSVRTLKWVGSGIMALFGIMLALWEHIFKKP